MIPRSMPDVVAFYELLRAHNPHLPEAHVVAAADPLQIEFGMNVLPVLNLKIFIKLPDIAVGDEAFSVYATPDDQPGEADSQEKDEPGDLTP